MVHEAMRAAQNDKSGNHQESEEDLALFVAATMADFKNIMVARQVMLKVMCKTAVLVSTKMASVIEIAAVRAWPKVVHAWWLKVL